MPSRYTDQATVCTVRDSCLQGPRDFSLFKNRPDLLWGPPSLLLNAQRGSFLGVKRPGLEANYSPPSSAEVKN